MIGQRVDVLAVLDHIADCDYIPVSTADLNATRAAVAELIEAMERAQKKLEHLHVHYSGAEANGIYSVIRQTKKALARVGGTV